MGAVVPWKKEPAAPVADMPISLSTFKPQFLSGPYLLGSNGQAIYADVSGEAVLVGIAVRTLVTTQNRQVPFLSQAHLFKASTSLYDCTEAAVRLASEADQLDEAELRARLRVLSEAGIVALCRATGILG